MYVSKTPLIMQFLCLFFKLPFLIEKSPIRILFALTFPLTDFIGFSVFLIIPFSYE